MVLWSKVSVPSKLHSLLHLLLHLKSLSVSFSLVSRLKFSTRKTNINCIKCDNLQFSRESIPQIYPQSDIRMYKRMRNFPSDENVADPMWLNPSKFGLHNAINRQWSFCCLVAFPLENDSSISFKVVQRCPPENLQVLN